jgi:VWFA-related protein
MFAGVTESMNRVKILSLKLVRHGRISSVSKSLLTTALLLPGCSILVAQTPDQSPHASTITVNARLVVLDVVVTSKDGKPVDGLTQKDFQVFEDDKLQSVRSFEPPSAHIAPAATTPEAASGAAAEPLDPAKPAKPAAFGLSPVTILVLDQLNTHFADSSFARRELRDYLAKQPSTLAFPTTLLTFYDNNFKQLQGFTRDRDALLRALQAAPTKNAWKLELSGKSNDGPAYRLDQSLRVVEQIAQSYAPIRGRKNLIWVGGGFPTIDPTVLDGPDLKDVKEALQHATNLLLDTRVTLYAVDPTSTAAGMTEITDAQQLSFAQLAGNEVAGAGDPYGIGDDFDRLGVVTGGRVIRGMNNVAAQIGDSIDLGSNFYTLSYSPSSTSQLEGKYRKIRVVCLRPDLTVTTRNGYYTPNPTQEKSNDSIAFDLSTAAESSIPLNGLQVTVEPNHSVAAEEETYIIHVGASSLTWEPGESGTSIAHVAIIAASESKQNKMIAHTLHGMTATARADTNLHDSTRTADFNFTAKAAAKSAKLRFVVRDAATGRMGSFDLPIEKQ